MAVDVDVPFPGSAIVANSHFNPDSLWSVHLSASKHILDEAPYSELSNAEVLIFENDELFERLEHSGNGTYRSKDSKPEDGKVYQLKVSVPDLGEVQAMDIIPEKVEILSGSWEKTFSEFGDEEYLVTIHINDPAGTKNFYMTEVLTYQYIYEERKPGEPFNGRIEPIDSILTGATLYTPDLNIHTGDQYSKNLIFPDVIFDGEIYPFQIIASHYSIRNQFVQNNEAIIYVILRSLSHSSYYYWKTLKIQQRGDKLSEPVSVFNNIEGGYGFFGAYHAETKRIKIEREIEEGEF